MSSEYCKFYPYCIHSRYTNEICKKLNFEKCNIYKRIKESFNRKSEKEQLKELGVLPQLKRLADYLDKKNLPLSSKIILDYIKRIEKL